MRKAEETVMRNFWQRRPMRAGTSPQQYGKRDIVEVDNNGDVMYKLWGHPVAKIEDGNLYVSDAGYQTTTTKSRLNAILSEWRIGVYQKNYEWFISMPYGKNFVDVPFKSGWNKVAMNVD
jgi:hypothetical protein